MTREQLMSAMFNRELVTIWQSDNYGYIGFINGIELEDGSLYSFNVKLLLKNGVTKMVYVRCQRSTNEHRN